MAKTTNTSGTSYLSAAEFLKRKDWRLVGDLVSDTDARVPLDQLPTDPNLAAVLLDASGYVEAACLAGNRYNPADLAALAATPSAGQALLFRLLTNLTEGFLVERRPDRGRPIPPAFEGALELCEQLRHGERIFPFQETMDAGNTSVEVETSCDVEARNLTTVQAQRLFGTRGNRR